MFSIKIQRRHDQTLHEMFFHGANHRELAIMLPLRTSAFFLPGGHRVADRGFSGRDLRETRMAIDMCRQGGEECI
jgi:hypothetical protein